MKKLSITLSVVLSILICSCGGSTETKEDKKEEVKKETKKLSKSTKEGMMAILDASDIKVPGKLEFEKVEKKSTSYVISFANDSVTDEQKEKLDQWLKDNASLVYYHRAWNYYYFGNYEKAKKDIGIFLEQNDKLYANVPEYHWQKPIRSRYRLSPGHPQITASF